MYRIRSFLVCVAVFMLSAIPVLAQTSSHGPVPTGVTNPSTVWGYPLVMGGVDTNGTVRQLQMDANGFIGVGGVYNATPPVQTNGTRGQTQMDSSANTKVTLGTLLWGEDSTNAVFKTVQKYVIAATYAYFWDTSFGTLATHNAFSGPALLESAHVTNVSNTILYFQIYNSTGSTSGTPAFCFPVAAGTATAPSVLILDQTFFGNGAYLATGLTWGCSTTQATYTGGTAANYNVNLGYAH